MTRFIHLTDLHISHPDADDPHVNLDTVALLERVVGLINDMDPQPEFVVASGDLTNLGDTPSYDLLQGLLAPLKAPLVMALGNHDNREAFHAVFGDGASDALYCHDRVHGPLHVITLDTLVPGQVSGDIEPAQFDFLQEALTRHPDLPKLIVMHHPPRIDPDALPWGTLDAVSTERLAEMLRDHRVAGILAGHIHVNRVTQWHGMPLIVCNGLDSAIDPLETTDLHIQGASALGLCDWRDTGLSVSYLPLTPVPPVLAVIDRARLETFE